MQRIGGLSHKCLPEDVSVSLPETIFSPRVAFNRQKLLDSLGE